MEEPSFNDVRGVVKYELAIAYPRALTAVIDELSDLLAQKIAYSGSVNGKKFGKGDIRKQIASYWLNEVHYENVLDKVSARIANRLLSLGICYCGNRFSGNNLCVLSACQEEE